MQVEKTEKSISFIGTQYKAVWNQVHNEFSIQSLSVSDKRIPILNVNQQPISVKEFSSVVFPYTTKTGLTSFFLIDLNTSDDQNIIECFLPFGNHYALVFLPFGNHYALVDYHVIFEGEMNAHCKQDITVIADYTDNSQLFHKIQPVGTTFQQQWNPKIKFSQIESCFTVKKTYHKIPMERPSPAQQQTPSTPSKRPTSTPTSTSTPIQNRVLESSQES